LGGLHKNGSALRTLISYFVVQYFTMSYQRSQKITRTTAQGSRKSTAKQGQILFMKGVMAALVVAGVGVLFSWQNPPSCASQKDCQPICGLNCIKPEPEKEQMMIHAIYQLNSKRSVGLSQLFTHKMARKLRHRHRLNVDVMSGDVVKNYYSLAANQRGILALKEYLKPTDSSNVALVQAVQRVREATRKLKEGQSLVVFLLTEGTDDPKTLREIRNVVQGISSQQGKFKLYLMGLDPQYKLKTVKAFHPIETAMAGSCIDEENQCLAFLKAVTD
jgi:hypothetical protein